ncbi:NUDIX domain-containing protein [Sporosarcina trichiuri]|uniref:NUDIX domain-containing protein n=1 Tax=Sporosarcina trichiuri TaxID=3056445 RepID=UPI0025B523A8|nr:NUDIX domain-containing protein [Sporosarcina sp. 0.2-SM1T-5]WJY27539.1 NUDIX domain-containing protein [Sporosarcina sp. 0.2-SM1T-5]
MAEKHSVLVTSVSIIREGKVFLVQEGKPAAHGKWNFPSGSIEYNEDILTAACREAKEETGLDVKLRSSTGVYNFVSDSGDQGILFHFVGEMVGGSVRL